MLSEMPEKLEALLQEQTGLKSDDVLIFTEADMDTECDFRHSVLILTHSTLTVGVCRDIMPSLSDNKPDPKKEREWKNYNFTHYPVADITDCGVDELVVGGVFYIKTDGLEQTVCAYTNTYKGIISRLCDVLKLIIDKQVIPEDKLYREFTVECCPKCGRRFPNKNRRVCPKCTDKRKTFLRLSSFFKPFAPHIAVMCLMSVLTSMMSAVWPYLNGTLLYKGVLAGDRSVSVLSKFSAASLAELLLLLALTMVGCKVLQQLFGIIQGRMVARVVPRVVSNIKNKVFGAIQSLSVSFFTSKRTGGLMTRIVSDAGEVSDLFIDGIPHILPNLFTFCFSFVIMIGINPVLAAVAVFSLPVAILISFKLQPKMWHYNSRNHQTSRDFRAKLNDSIVGARVVKAFGTEESETERLSHENVKVYNAQHDSLVFDTKFSALYEIANSLMSLLVWGVGVCFVLAVFKPQMTYGDLVTFTGYVTLLADPAHFFARVIRWWSSSMNSAQRIFEIIDAAPDVVETAKPRHIDNVKGDIKIENVTFGYDENRSVIKDMSLDIKAGETVGIVGKSGAGKSTLALLLSRLYDPDSGHIYLDGIDLKELSFADIRRSVALVSQETYIFRGSIFENIAYANPKASKYAVIDAAKMAGAHDFICRLPDGYDTFVGSGGRSLSGGERQRVSIARAILADPRVLILDEATAAVDTETERNIQAALEKLSCGRTTLSIAHRISTLKNADKLIVIEDGRITEQGTHSELFAKQGAYYKLRQIQNESLKFRSIGE